MSEEEIKSRALASGRALKRKNSLVAMLCGALPGLLLGLFVSLDTQQWLIGLGTGILWANAFEYSYHRWLLHLPKSSFGKAHLLHHRSVGMEDEAEHLTFGGSALWVALLFLTNGLVALALGYLLGFGFSSGTLTAFSLYFMAVEEIHWRIHLGGWLPLGLERARPYHLAHHDLPNGRFNVFLPIFDWALGNLGQCAGPPQVGRAWRWYRVLDWRLINPLCRHALVYGWLIAGAIILRFSSGTRPS